MRTPFLTLIGVAMLFLAIPRLSSQNAPQPEETLKSIKAANAALIQRQQKTLEQLETLKQEATTIKILAKRS